MTRWSLLLRTARYFRWSNLAVAAGVAVATAVLTGALMVGDSVRDSLHVLAVQRLGPVDHALVAARFFGDTLADRIERSPDFKKGFDQARAGIVVRGGAGNEALSDRTAGVQIAAIAGNWAAVAQGTCVVNGELADSLSGVKVEGKVVFSIPKLEDGPKDATLARRGRGDVISDLTVQPRVARVAREAGFESMFNLAGGQRTPRNAWLNLGDLQEAVAQPGRANVLLVHGGASIGAAPLNAILHDVVTLDDYGLSVSSPAVAGNKPSEAVLTSSDTYLLKPVVEAADMAAKAVGTNARRVSSYLVNTAYDVTSKKSLHYAMIAGVEALGDRALASDEIALNEWTADHLGAKVGDSVRLDYYHRETNGDLKDVASDRPGTGLLFRIAVVLPMSGMGADPTLTPTYKGLTDSSSVSDWKAPAGVSIRKEWVTKDDETYWKKYKAAPKLFINLDSAKKLWGGPFGDVTSIRVPAEKADAFTAELRKRIDPARMGLAFRPIRAEQLAATSGSTDFAELFLYFSFFLIGAAVLLVAMLFRLNIEQRARQLGLMAAVGFAPKSLRNLALAEGVVVAVIGAAIGLVGAVGYTALMMAGLRTWWLGAVGTRAMRLHAEPVSLVYGFIGSLLVAVLAIVWGVWRVSRTPAGRLLAGGWGSGLVAKARGRWGMRIGWSLLLVAFGLIGCGVVQLMSPTIAFLSGGTLLLAAGLTLLSGQLRPKRDAAVSDSLSALGFRNASRHSARSVLTMGLIAFATFALVSVAAFRGAAPEDTGDKRSGAGGYRLMLRADIPLTGDLNTEAGRDVLAVSNAEDPLWGRLHFTPMRRWAGEDISCLNLTRPGSPTILSVPAGMVDRDAFSFGGSMKTAANKWKLLDDPELSKDAVPVIADDETAQYILHLDLGKTIEVTDQTGARRKLLLVATLAGSVFQGELLMGESNFVNLFPSQGGAGVEMVDTGAKDAAGAAKMLAGELGDFSVTVDRTADVLAMYKNVQDTYMSTFQVLGSLGLLLGTVGLAVVLLRGLIERKSELAMLAAIGFRRFDRLRMVLVENVLLLVLGLAVGAVCATIAMLPALVQSGRPVHFAQLLVTLGGILLAGFASLTAAVWFGGRRIGAADLRSE